MARTSRGPGKEHRRNTCDIKFFTGNEKSKTTRKYVSNICLPKALESLFEKENYDNWGIKQM
jgi:hypothetical protein